MAVVNKIRTVFYAQQGLKSFVERMVALEGFKSESDAIDYLCAHGMRAHTQQPARGGTDDGS